MHGLGDRLVYHGKLLQTLRLTHDNATKILNGSLCYVVSTFTSSDSGNRELHALGNEAEALAKPCWWLSGQSKGA